MRRPARGREADRRRSIRPEGRHSIQTIEEINPLHEGAIGQVTRPLTALNDVGSVRRRSTYQ